MKGAFFLGNREFEVRDMEKRPLAADEVRILSLIHISEPTRP